MSIFHFALGYVVGRATEPRRRGSLLELLIGQARELLLQWLGDLPPPRDLSRVHLIELKEKLGQALGLDDDADTDELFEVVRQLAAQHDWVLANVDRKNRRIWVPPPHGVRANQR